MFDDDSRWGDARDRHDDPRDIESRDREPVDPRDVFAHDLDLPRSDERERVHDRDQKRARAVAVKAVSPRSGSERSGEPCTATSASHDVDRRPVTSMTSCRVPYRAWLSSGVQSACCSA